MAKKKRGAKSQAIREQLSANPDAMPKDVIATLKKKGMSVSSQMVSTLKSKMSGGTKKRRRRKKRVAARQNGQMISMNDLVEAKKLADRLGGLEKAQEAVAALAKLQ